jgi:predicted acylesterase/phospholipase RssA
MAAPCALALTGGVAKGAFHAGVLKAFAEARCIPSVIVGTSAGALNGSFAAKLIAEDQFTPEKVEHVLGNMWLYQASFQKLWSRGEIHDHSLRSLVGDIRPNLFMLRRLLGSLHPGNLHRVREFLELKFTSILSERHYREQIEKALTAPEQVKRSIHFSASLTSLTGTIETYADQPLVGYGSYLSFYIHPGLGREQLDTLFRNMCTVVQASGSFPGVFPPVAIQRGGKTDLYIDGGLTKNAPFGRAIKLDPEVRTIYLVSTMPVTQPDSGRIDNMLTIIDQIYKIILNKDLVNDFRKIHQINEKIELVGPMLHRDEQGQIVADAFNHNLLKIGGFKDIADFERRRTVRIVIIEPPVNMEGDPFAGMYRSDRMRLLREYMALGYTAAQQVLQQERTALP